MRKDEKAVVARMFGNYIKRAREDKGYSSPEKLGHEIDLNPRTIERIENEGAAPKLHTIFKLQEALDLDLNHIFYEINSTVKKLPPE
ncbi:helix-turn-helix transcriptional regulator [Virgibacillus sp. MSP4-1]|uniref:helix-turn-helix transcriptional regulator n=1 Tax=Virgibacillus sp. MSP4-1 TaxID=2700081 RepID=UPI00039B758E|nr:helix-turn-helix transcriptional regulator [Virgibacillus sp. MSP4-1]QHS23456.1 helix-turn-helix transcriptional regulator [Virgibacillus sp. MSP4-1]